MAWTKILSGFWIVLTLGLPAWADGSSNTAPVKLPDFIPRDRGAPKNRVGAGSRGDDNQGQYRNVAQLYVLAPEQTGYTLSGNPVLYWYISDPISQTVEISITDKLQDIFTLRINGIVHAGLQSLDLSLHRVELQPNVKYRWSIAIINNAEQRSADTFASASIIRVADGNALPPSYDSEQQLANYFQQGIWYDAFSLVQTLAAKQPNEQIKAIRVRLLTLANLPELN